MKDPDSIFLEARALPAEQRGAFLEQICAGDVELRARLERMLGKADQAATFFEESVHESPTAMQRPGLGAEPGGDEGAGKVIGRYKLLQTIGEGGMGVVYMAEQEEPVRRRVALKIIKLGMDTKAVVARFESERQALAMMDHPHIARVLDGGATESGRPYFVMELVQGVPITEFCDRNKLSLRDRLDLFLPVCRAIQSAHQKGIIHRDIKPSNVMVTLNHGEPVAKVIDFGVAKATHQKLTEKTVFTQYGSMIGTPAYMSPEQAEMTSLDVDTRTDVYSLGVLLYELLTGTTPFSAKRLLSLGFGQMQRVIAEEEPQKPSTRLSTLVGEERSILASQRGKDLSALSWEIKGDLDWIVMKCLEKDRRRRYDTPNELAADLKRHLSNEPVLARPPSRVYEFQKSVRRHKFGFAAATALILVLTAGVLTSTWQAVRATRARAESDQARLDAEAISSFLTGMFESSHPGAEQGGREVKVADILEAAAANLATNLTAQPAQRARLQATLGETYLRLGLAQEALPLQEAARDYYLKTLGPGHPETLKTAGSLAESYDFAGRRDDALKLREATLELCRKVLGPEHPGTLKATHQLARSYLSFNRTDDAIHLEEKLLPVAQRLLGPDDVTVLGAMNALGSLYQIKGRLNEAIGIMEKTLPLIREAKGQEHPYTLQVMGTLAGCFTDAGRLDEALSMREEVLALSRKVSGTNHGHTLSAMGQLSETYGALGRRDAAVRLAEEMWRLTPNAFGSEEHPYSLHIMFRLAETYRQAGRLDEAIGLLDRFRAVAGRVRGAEDRLTIGSLVVLGDCYHETGRREEALRLREEALRLLVNTRGRDDRDTAVTMTGLAKSYHAAGRLEEALKLGEEALAILRQAKGPEDSDTIEAMTQLAVSLQAADRVSEAITLGELALPLLRKKYPGWYETRIEALETLILCYDQTGRKAKADVLRKEFTHLQTKLAKFKPAPAP